MELRSGDVNKEIGVWTPAVSNGNPSAWMSCPKCGCTGSLADHSIALSGEVSPSVVCPIGCGFHDYVKLVGYHGHVNG